jgi:hypothetical protein
MRGGVDLRLQQRRSTACSVLEKRPVDDVPRTRAVPSD